MLWSRVGGRWRTHNIRLSVGCCATTNGVTSGATWIGLPWKGKPPPPRQVSRGPRDVLLSAIIPGKVLEADPQRSSLVQRTGWALETWNSTERRTQEPEKGRQGEEWGPHSLHTEQEQMPLWGGSVSDVSCITSATLHPKMESETHSSASFWVGPPGSFCHTLIVPPPQTGCSFD